MMRRVFQRVFSQLGIGHPGIITCRAKLMSGTQSQVSRCAGLVDGHLFLVGVPVQIFQEGGGPHSGSGPSIRFAPYCECLRDGFQRSGGLGKMPGRNVHQFLRLCNPFKLTSTL